MKKMYICVHENVPDYMTPTLVAHATLRHHLKYQNDDTYTDWLNNSFRKCVVKVNQKEFNKILKLPNIECSFENTVMNAETSCITIIADTDDHKVLKFSKLWKPFQADKYMLISMYPSTMEYVITNNTYNSIDELFADNDYLHDIDDNEKDTLLKGDTLNLHSESIEPFKLVKI